MKEVFHDAGFWGFMTTCVGMLKYRYMLKSKAIKEKAAAEMDVERFRATRVGEIFTRIEQNVNLLNRFAVETTQKLERFNSSIEQVKLVESNMISAQKELKVECDKFHTTMSNVKAGGNLVLKRLDELERKIETEVTKLSSGNVWVRTKK